MTALNNLSLRVKMLSSALLILLLMLAVATTVYRGLEEAKGREAVVTRGYEVKAGVENLFSDILTMQSSYRGFLIGGDERFLGYYEESRQEYPRILARAEALIDDQALRERLRAIDRDVQSWLATHVEPGLQLREDMREGRGSATSAEISALVQQDKPLIDAVRQQVVEFQLLEDELLRARSQEALAANTALETTVVAGTVLAFLVGLISSFAIATSIARRVGLVARAAVEMSAGRLAQDHALPEGRDEVGIMATAFGAMAGTIRRQMADLEQSTVEAQRLQQAEQEGRERLERAVGDYLSFVRQVAQGRLSERLTLHYDGALGELGDGLNTMAASLEAAQAEALRLRQAETEGRLRLERAVAEYLAFAQRVADGDLSQRLAVHEDGALGQLGQGLNSMVASLHSITQQVQQAANNMAAATSEILAATVQQVASAAQQSASITETTTTIEEVKSIARQTAQQAGQVAADSAGALQIARQGTQAVEETVGGMGQIKARVDTIAETILSLSEQTQAIGTIIQTVSELADQSNLLALNAAIEAARAGQQGKSFAIVAQHVRDLAERSKAATGQVREILGEIQQATNAAVMVTEEGSKGVEVGARLAAEAGQVIHRIAGEVEGGAQANVQMAAAAQQQTAGMEQIGLAMVSIQQATTQTLASTRQAERAAQDLNGLAQSLQKAVAAYRV